MQRMNPHGHPWIDLPNPDFGMVSAGKIHSGQPCIMISRNNTKETKFLPWDSVLNSVFNRVIIP